MLKAQREPGTVYRLARKPEESCCFFAQRKFANEIDHHRSPHSFRNIPMHLSTFDKGQIGVQLRLEHQKMLPFVIFPTQVITY